MSIEEPNEYDVLCGKDKTFSKHKGNIIFREKIMSMASQYKIASTKPARMKLTKVIVDSLKSEYNAKFLRSIPISNDTYLWEEISDQQARDKTSHALRFALGKDVVSKKAADTSSSTKSRRRQSSRRSTISNIMATSDTSVDDDRKVKSITKAIGRSKRGSRDIVSPASAPSEIVSSSSFSPIKNLPYATIPTTSVIPKIPTRIRHRRSNSDDSSETTVVTVDSEDVSTTEYLTSIGGEDDYDDVSQTIQNEIEVLYCDNQHPFIIDHDDTMDYPYSSIFVRECNYHNDVYADINIPPAAVRYHLQGVRSSPARLGSPPSAAYFREKSESSKESTTRKSRSSNIVQSQQQPIGWTIDRLDLSVRDSDLNDFLDEEITNDWENQNDGDDNVNT